ncbi:SAV_6107 family HEPN domain-containing protein [Streptomyces canus]|uniref:SAV_6107 family HEPN domain-containing protein n=1 Tax=Streptomyces canus TaxID=58343 RepID=UPI0036AC1C72
MPAVQDLLDQAHYGLESASELDNPMAQYAEIHLAALRTAAAVLAALGRPEPTPRRRARIRSAWEVLPEIAPELSEFAEYFGRTARKRARAEAGIPGTVDAHDLEDIRYFTTLFLQRVESLDAIQNPPAVREAGSGNGATAMRRSS